MLQEIITKRRQTVWKESQRIVIEIHAEELINLTTKQFVTLLVAKKKVKRHSMIETKKDARPGRPRQYSTLVFSLERNGIFGTGLELCIVSFDNGMSLVSAQAAVSYLRNTEM